MVGDAVGGETVEIRLKWSECSEGERLRLIVDGEIAEEIPVEASGERSWTLNAGEMHRHYRWCVVEIRGANGEMRAVTNPIYLLN